MAAPTYQDQGTFVGVATGSTITWPTHVANDVALLIFESTEGEAVTLTTAAGFVQVTNSPQATSSGGGVNGTRVQVYWCRATGSSQTNPVAADPGNHLCGIIVTFRGCTTSGDPWDVTAGNVKSTTSTSSSMPAVTTTVDNALIVNCIGRGSDQANNQYTNEANANLTGLSERVDLGTQTQNGGGIVVYTGVKATAGNTGSTTATITNTSQEAYLTIALKSGGADATPATITPTVAINASTAAAGATITGATITPTVAIFTPTILAESGDTTATPATVPLAATVNAPTTTAAATATPSAVTPTITVNAPTTTAGATVTPVTPALLATIPTPDVQAGQPATATPATFSAAVTIPTSPISAGTTTTPGVVAVSAAVASATTTAAATATPNSVAATLAMIAPTVTGGVAIILKGDVGYEVLDPDGEHANLSDDIRTVVLST